MYLEAVGTEKSFGRLQGSLSAAFPVARWSRGLARVEAITLAGPEAPVVYAPSLGGPFRMSSFGTHEFRGRHAVLGHLGYLHALAKLPDPLGDRLFAVGLLEVGSAFEELSQASFRFSATRKARRLRSMPAVKRSARYAGNTAMLLTARSRTRAPRSSSTARRSS